MRAGDHRALWFWREDKDLRLPEPSLAAEVTRAGDGFEVTLTAPSLQKDVSLLVDKVDPDATVDDMLVTLLPGEARTFHVRTSTDIEPRSLLRRGAAQRQPARVPLRLTSRRPFEELAAQTVS